MPASNPNNRKYQYRNLGPVNQGIIMVTVLDIKKQAVTEYYSCFDRQDSPRNSPICLPKVQLRQCSALLHHAPSSIAQYGPPSANNTSLLITGAQATRLL
jgi:hypothetical protein